jgi:hypothetical protein
MDKKHTDILEQIIELEGGWSPSDGACYGVYDRYGIDSCIWTISWQFPDSSFPMVRTISPDMMLPVETMDETRMKKHNWSVESYRLNEILFNALAGLDWMDDIRALLKRCRTAYPTYASKQAVFVQGSIHAGFHPFYKV